MKPKEISMELEDVRDLLLEAEEMMEHLNVLAEILRDYENEENEKVKVLGKELREKLGRVRGLISATTDKACDLAEEVVKK